MLDSEPLPGLRGVLKDLLRVTWVRPQGQAVPLHAPPAVADGLRGAGRSAGAWRWRASAPKPALHTLRLRAAGPAAPRVQGARLVTVFMTPLVTPLTLLPLVPQLALQVFAVLMVRA